MGVARVCETVSANLVNAIVRDPSVYPYIHDDSAPPPEDFDISVLFQSPHNHFLKVEMDDGSVGGMFVLRALSETTYEVHTCLLPKCRGESALMATRLGTEWVFTRTACTRIVTSVPAWNVAAERLTLASGMVLEYERPDSWCRDGELYGQAYYAISVYQWIWKVRSYLLNAAEALLDAIEQIQDDNCLPVSAPDEERDVMLSYAYLCAIHGMPHKGLLISNEWGLGAGNAPLQYERMTADGAHVVSFPGMSLIIEPDGSVRPKEEQCPQSLQ